MRKSLKAWVGATVLATSLISATDVASAATVVYVGKDAGVEGIYGREYRYKTIANGGGTPGANWYSDSFDHSTWALGKSEFGNTVGINGLTGRETFWDVNSSLFAFKTFTLASTVDMVAKLAADNGFDLYINGTLAASANAEGFTHHWEYTYNLDASLFNVGTNTIGIEFKDHGGLTAGDFALVGDSAGLVAIPLPAAAWGGMALMGLIGVKRMRGSNKDA